MRTNPQSHAPNQDRGVSREGGTSISLPRIHRGPHGASVLDAQGASSLEAVVRSPGQPLERGLRSHMEAQFQHDFSRVRVHADAAAADSAEGLNARAYTLGQHVVFGTGALQPETDSGHRLLAHELAHVVQQTRGMVPIGVQRQPKDETPTPAKEGPFSAMLREQAELRRFDFKADLMKQDFKRVYQANQKAVDDALALARASRFRLEYLAAIRTSLKTPYEGDRTNRSLSESERKALQEKYDATRTENEATLTKQAAEAKAKQATPEGKKAAGTEEAATAAVPTKAWTRMRGGFNHSHKFFYADKRDPKKILIHAKVRLVAASGEAKYAKQNQENIKLVKAIEDEIEKSAAAKGYVVNLEFTDIPSQDAFDVTVDSGAWTDAGNWVGTAKDLAHELHHALGLDDRYDYLNHQTNTVMPVETRLHWISEQIKKDTKRDSRQDPLRAKSLMGEGKDLVDEDVCEVIKAPEAACVNARKNAAP